MIRPGLRRCRSVGAEPHRLERSRPKILDQHLCAGDQIGQQFAAARIPEVQRHALLVARIDLPVDADPVGLPGAQRVAALRVLDLDDLRAEIGELETDHIAGNEPRQIDDAYAVERTRRLGLKGFLRHTHRAGPVPQLRDPLSLASPRPETKGSRSDGNSAPM